MSGKRLRSESVVGPVPRDPCDMVKAKLPEPQSPDGVMPTPAGRTLETRRHPLHWPIGATNATPMGGSRPMRSEQGMNGAPKSRYHVLCQRNAGLPKGGDPYGNGALIVVRAGESSAHGEGGRVVKTKTTGRYS